MGQMNPGQNQPNGQGNTHNINSQGYSHSGFPFVDPKNKK